MERRLWNIRITSMIQFNMAKELNAFTVKFDGQLHQVNATTLISSLVNLSSVIQEVNNELYGDQKLDIKISAPERGSFEIDLAVLVDQATQLFSKDNIETAAYIIGGVVGLFEIKKHLKGKKPKKVTEEGSKTILENEHGKTIIEESAIYEIYQKNSQVDDAIGNVFGAIQEEAGVNAFEIRTNNKTASIKIEKDDFEAMTKKSEVLGEETRVQTKNTTLHIVKVVFEGDRKWDFLYLGNKISASIKDEDFIEKINQGERFAKGDSLEVELEIQQIFDKSINAYLNRSYTVTKVSRHVPREKPQQLNFEKKFDEEDLES